MEALSPQPLRLLAPPTVVPACVLSLLTLGPQQAPDSSVKWHLPSHWLCRSLAPGVRGRGSCWGCDCHRVLTSQNRSESEANKVRSALILCYGHVAAGAPRELLLARVEADLFWNMSQCFSTKVGVFWVSQRLGAGRCLRSRLCDLSHFCCPGSGDKGRNPGTVCGAWALSSVWAGRGGSGALLGHPSPSSGKACRTAL